MVLLITIMHIYLVKAIYCVKDLISLNRWQNLTGVTYVTNVIIWLNVEWINGASVNGESHAKRKQRAKIVGHFMMN